MCGLLGCGCLPNPPATSNPAAPAVLPEQELYAEYAGYGMAGQVVYFDSAFGIGAEGKNLRPGVDCPEGAVYFGVSALT